MGSSLSVHTQATCTSSSPLSLWPLPLLQAPHPTEPLPLMLQLRSCPLSLMPMSIVWLMTTLRPTSRKPRPRISTEMLPALSPSPSLTAVSRPPPTPLTTPTVSLLRSPTRAPLSTPQSLQEDMATLPQLLLDTDPLPQCTSLPESRQEESEGTIIYLFNLLIKW